MTERGSRRWIAELSKNGVEGVSERKGAFGLTKKQVADVTDDLMQPVRFSTKGLKPTDRGAKNCGRTQAGNDSRRRGQARACGRRFGAR